MLDTVPKTWPEWTDTLGNVFRPGDYIAVATISSRSPQLVIAKVERINRFDSKGEEIVDTHYRTEPCSPNEPGAYLAQRKWDATQGCYVSADEVYHVRRAITSPSCTVTAKPAVDGRNFSRWSKRSVTYRILGNIIKIDPPAGLDTDEEGLL